MKNQEKAIPISHDIQFTWLTRKYGSEWEEWRRYAEEWLSIQDTILDSKIAAIRIFFVVFLMEFAKCSADPIHFFKSDRKTISTNNLLRIFRKDRPKNSWMTKYCNYCVDFIDWTIDEHFTDKNDRGVSLPTVTNPLTKTKSVKNRQETVYTPLPYRYIERLREILCPNPNGSFSDWKWAIERATSGDRLHQSNWFEVPASLIDEEDPDCVWRVRMREHRKKNAKRKIYECYEIWSPVTAMFLFIKLHLPLRNYQVRMLDSGEADTWRYSGGQWVENTRHSFRKGTLSRPYARGVFKKILDQELGTYSTGLYINTNKSADSNKDFYDKGYVIPWENHTVLYWLEKLRNWQEKYNPIIEATDFSTLEPRHIGNIKSVSLLEEMGSACFLFRQFKGRKDSDRDKPCAAMGKVLWYQLLRQLECDLAKDGEVLDSGQALKFVFDYDDKIKPGSKKKTYFPLHSLRVSLITAYTLNTDLPLPIISKLLAGHSSLLMTLYYTKITPGMMREKMEKADQKLLSDDQESIKSFLANAKPEQIQHRTVYNSGHSIEAALAKRNPVGWEYRSIGLCLVGGNTLQSNESPQVPGCWNGGRYISGAKAHGPVPHGTPDNCVRCRWFITDASYLDILHRHGNQKRRCYRKTKELALDIRRELEELKDAQYAAQESGKPFLEHGKLQSLHRRYEKQTTEADEYLKDYLATVSIIKKIMKIELERKKGDDSEKLVAVGSADDIEPQLRFIETDSTLLELAIICRDAEIYPDLLDDLRKTDAIEERSAVLNRILMRNGFEPLLLNMSKEEQLIAGNAMLRQMAKVANSLDEFEGYQQAANYLEAEEYLIDNKLLKKGINALPQQPLKLPSPRKQKLIQAK